jgi:prepilin-type N-terminal cleavage/methylation domain-containing protein
MEPSFNFFGAVPPVATTAHKGFTLVEMLVVLAIIIVITAIVITGQSTYNQTLLLTDTSYTVAYSMRQAQSLGLASRGINSISNAGYGVHFGGTTGYIVFADTGPTTKSLPQSVCPVGDPSNPTPDTKPGNCKYDGSPTDVIVQNYTFSRGYTIQNICGQTSSGGTCVPVASLDAVFMRPETRAILVGPSNQSFVCAQVTVTAPTGGATRIVHVSQLGEISVGSPCP